MKIKEYLEWLRNQKCVFGCNSGVSQPHHTGSHGTAKRNHDEDCCSLCFHCHRGFHDGQMYSKAGLQRKADEQFANWLATLDEKKRNNILLRLRTSK